MTSPDMMLPVKFTGDVRFVELPSGQTIELGTTDIAALLFPFLQDGDKWSRWGVNDKGEMVAPMREGEGFRPIEWRDLLPER